MFEIPEIPSYAGLKSIHLIFMVCYFAGIFYLIRLFVYYVDAEQKLKQEKNILQKQYAYMMSRLWDIIIVPGGIIMTVCGVFMATRTVADIDYYVAKQPWFHIKGVFLVVLLIYHIWSWRAMKAVKRGTFHMSSVALRMMNEVATLLLFAIIFIAIFKANFIDMWIGLLLSFVILVSTIMLVVKLVNRKKK